MTSVWRIYELLLLLPLVQAQSGDGRWDTVSGSESRISCSSHMSIEGNSLTCELLRGRDHDGDDDEDDGDAIERMTLCHTDWTVDVTTTRCVEDCGNTLTFTEAPVVDFTLTVHLTSGANITTTIDPKRIVKPRRPQVWNVTFDPESNQAVVQVRSPYHNDYLTADNQLFQLHIWTTSTDLIQNITSETHLKMDMEHLWRNTEYQVAVRAIPVKLLAGSWSEWSETSRFLTPAGGKVLKPTDERREMLIKLLVCLLPLLLVTVTALFFRKNKIFMYMWPNIPHPKDTLVQICKPNKGLLLNLNPEVFSALRVSPTLQPREETEPPLSPDDDALSDDPGSTQSSDCRSTATEELEFSALLSRSSSDGEDGLHSDAPSPVQDPRLGGGGTEAQVFGRGQQEEAYVTMSSFYQIK